MDFLIGSITCIGLLALFHLLERNRIPTLGKNVYVFIVLGLAVSYLFQPAGDLSLWLGVACLLYAALDDLLSKTIHIYVPILATVLFLLFTEKPYFFLLSFSFFLLFLLLTKLTQEKIIGEGDVYVFLPLSFLLIENIGDVSLLSVSAVWVEAWLISTLLALVFFLPLKIWKPHITEFPLVPFLLLGSCLVYTQWTYTPWVFLGSCLLAVFWLMVYLVFWVYRVRGTKKK